MKPPRSPDQMIADAQAITVGTDEDAHRAADELMIQVLTELGYGQAVDLLERNRCFDYDTWAACPECPVDW